MSINLQTVLPSGAGLIIPKDKYFELSPEKIRWMLMKKGFVLVKGVDYDKDGIKKLVNSYGKMIEYVGEKANIGFGYKDIQEIDGEEGKINTGRGELALHSDGGILGTRVDLVFLYGAEVKNVKYQGSTGICDHVQACKEMPFSLRRVLEEEIFEIKVIEQNYYGGAIPKDWYHIPVFVDLGWTKKMLILFPFEENSEKGWEVRMKGFSEVENINFFKELKAFMTQPRYYYKHYWNTGDLLIFDNRKVLHAREAFDTNSTRVLYRGQIETPDNEPNLSPEEYYRLDDWIDSAKPM